MQNLKNYFFRSKFSVFIIIILLPAFFSISNLQLYSADEESKDSTTKTDDSSDKVEVKRGNRIFRIPKDVYNYLKDRPEEMLKYLKKMEYYKQEEDSGKTDSDDMNNILVFVSEIPLDNRTTIFAPIFLANRQRIFDTRTDFSIKMVGYKTTMKFKQKKFPWKNTSLTETLIGSFLYASGTNIGFNRGKLEEEKRFYTNYFSEIVTLKINLPLYSSVAFALDSRQYFFVERDTPEGFIMPRNHYNIFPRMDASIGSLKVNGVDQLTSGLKISSWAGYGIRNRWEEWGDPDNLQMGEEARTFLIYTVKLQTGLLINNNHNFVLRARYKGGIDNDFLSRPRFGGTIDNANLDVVHGFALDEFRVTEFGLVNTRYGFDIIERLRFNLFFDYAHICAPSRQDIFGSGYGVRIIAVGGLPIWITHGIGRKYYPEKKSPEQIIMVMTAAGW